MGKMFLIAATLAAFMSGCSFNGEAKSTEVKKTYVDISEDKNVSQVLKELEEVTGNIYLLTGDDIGIRPSSYQVTDIDGLDHYMQSADGTRVVIAKNRYLEGVPKIVEIHRVKSEVIVMPEVKVEEVKEVIVLAPESFKEMSLSELIEHTLKCGEKIHKDVAPFIVEKTVGVSTLDSGRVRTIFAKGDFTRQDLMNLKESL